MRVALDIDGTISEHPEFFGTLSRALKEAGHFIAVMTFRPVGFRTLTEKELDQWGVVYHELHFVEEVEDKGRLCGSLEIDVFFEDMDEFIVGVPKRTLVCKIRNEGNFDFDGRKWI